MAISFQRYIDITSGVGGAGVVRQRDLIGRIFTTNALLPTGTNAEFESAAEVGEYFGTASVEYLRALFYFSWISKNIVTPQKLSFARWADAATAPQIFGAKGAQALGSWTSITAGSFTLTLGGVTNTMSTLNFSGAADLAGVATIIQTAIRTKTGSMWTAATVTYDATRQSFNFTGGTTGAANVIVTAGAGGSDIAAQLGWLSPSTILSFGAITQTITTVLTASSEASDNFASFLFMKALADAEVLEAAVWNNSQNVKYIFCVPTLSVDAADYFDALADYAGVACTLTATAGEYPEMVPMMILAATDYQKRDSVQNFMFQKFELTPSVTTTADANIYDPLRVNYYGRTQTAGQFVDFYQRGDLMGQATDPIAMNVYANEIWLKDSAGSNIMELLLSLARVSANKKGRAQIMAVLQATIDQALFNGVISVGKPLNTTQKLYITQITGDELAWRQVQNIGYWMDCVITSYVTTGGITEWKATYTLAYSKDDSIRKVEGTHVLI